MKDDFKLIEAQTGFLVPADEVLGRIGALRNALRRDGIDAALMTHGSDVFYFSGTYQAGVLVVPADGDVVFFAGKSFQRARAESPLGDVRRPGRGRETAAAVRSMCGGKGRVKIGFAFDVIPAGQYLRLLNDIGDADAADIAGTIRKIRMVKSPWEIRQISGAAAQAAPVFDRMADLFSAGITELELSARIEMFLRMSGHPGMVRVRRPGQEFSMLLVSSGSSAAYPMHLDGPVGFTGLYPPAVAGAGLRVVGAGDTFMADIVTYYNGYQADNARTFAVGTPHDEIRRAHEFCRDALREITRRMVPGASCAKIFDEVSAWAAERGEPEGFMGYGENRVRFFGHGIGLELDEWPILARGFDTSLAEGMVLAVEPKAFSVSRGPAGLENTYLITKDGARSFCPSKEEIAVL
jgi:Xaa-Pro dipeptidase